MTPQKLPQCSGDKYESNTCGKKTDSGTGCLLHLPYLLPRRWLSGQFDIIRHPVTPCLEAKMDSPDSFDSDKMKRSRERQSIITNDLHKRKANKSEQMQEQYPTSACKHQASEQNYSDPLCPWVPQPAGKKVWQHRTLVKDQSGETWRRLKSEGQINITNALHKQNGQTPRRQSSSPSRRPDSSKPSEPEPESPKPSEPEPLEPEPEPGEDLAASPSHALVKDQGRNMICLYKWIDLQE